jgi:5-methylcytosine-specific restriction endonuclease McrA
MNPYPYKRGGGRVGIVGFHETVHADPRVYQVGSEAFGLWVMSVCYASRNATEVYPHDEVGRRDPRGRLTPLLIGAGFWEWDEDQDEGYWVLNPATAGANQPFFRFFHPQSDVPPDIRRAVFARDGHICQICWATEDLTLDHIWPQVLGGEHTMENLRVLCRSCNSSKGARV